MRQDASIHIKMEYEMSFDIRSDDMLLGIEEICKRLGISRSTFERIRNPKSVAQPGDLLIGKMLPDARHEDIELSPFDQPFPEPTIKLGRSPRWSAKAVNAWISSIQPKPNPSKFPFGS